MSTSRARVAVNTAAKLLHTPEIALQYSKALLRRRVILPINYHFRDGRSGPFDLVHIKLVNACNLRCKMCGQWGETGFHFNQAPQYLKELVPVEVHMRMLDEVSRLRPWISISGGEAFLHPNALALVAYTKKKGLTVTVSTNGLSLAEHGARLVELGVDFLYVSVDGSREAHDEIRGLKGAFEKTVAGMKAVQQQKRQSRRFKPYVLISAAVSKDNARNFDDIFRVAEDVRADGLVASYGWFQTEESCQRHEAVMAKKLGTAPVSHRGWLWSFGEIDTTGLVEAVKRIDAGRWSFPFTFTPKLTYDEIPRYYREHSNTFGAERCLCPWSVVEVLPNGDVATCIDMPDYIAGNIKEHSLLDIWNNDRYKKFRCVLKEEGHLPACTRCSGLIGGGL